MKKITLNLLLIAALSFAFTSCLKDKVFENFEYGINDPDTQPPGVGFPRGSAAKYSVGINLTPAPQAITGAVFVNLESGSPAPADIQVTLTDNTTALLNAYNAANGTSILPLPTSQYTLPLTLIIPAGARNAEVPITVSNADLLDPNKSYAVGVTISAVSGNYIIAQNLKNLLIEIGLKNKYDGVYNLKGIHNRTPYTFPFETTVEMWTTGPNSVAMYWPAGGDFGQPIGIGPGSVNWYGNAVSPNFHFNPATDLCTNVTLQVGNAVTLAMVTLDAVADMNPDGPIVNRYEPGANAPSTGKMYLSFQYNGNDLRRFYDTLSYTGPR
jgi:hypothetical protein